MDRPRGGDRVWYYLRDGVTVGPLPDQALRSLSRAGDVPSDTLAWTEGMSDWAPIDVALSGFAAASEPLPAGSNVYFAVSELKFAIMSVVTLGLYELYWFYKNWQFLKVGRGLKCSPFWRAWFSVFWCHQLLATLRDEAENRGLAVNYSAGWLTAAYVVLLLSARIDPIWFITVLSFVPLLPAVAIINTLNSGARDDTMNRRFTAWNVVGIVVGGPFLLLAILGTLLPAS